MPVKLSDKDRDMLQGQNGPAVQMAMRILVRMAEVVEADELLDISQVHIDGCGLMSRPSLDFAETLAQLGGKVCVPTTLNMGPLDLQNWREFGVDEEFAGQAIRQGQAYYDMGCIPTWTCAPYQSYLTPRFGQQIAWGESNAIAYANSVLGARTNRYGDYLDLCAALTGRAPKYGLHIKANRRGEVLFRLVDIDPALMKTTSFYVVLGHWLGKQTGNKIPVIEGVSVQPRSDQFKAMTAAIASSGMTALFHIIGVTPEAATVDEAFQGGEPEQVIDIHMDDLLEGRDDLSTAQNDIELDVVVVGCPHFSYDEFAELARLIKGYGKPRHRQVRFVIISCETSYALARRGDCLKTITDWGAEITLDTCHFHTPMIAPETKVLMTNSGKCAYYAPGHLNVKVAFGSLADCVLSATEGRIRREESW